MKALTTRVLQGTALLAAFCLGSFSAVAAQPVAPDTIEQARKELHQAIEAGQVAGGALLIVRDGKRVALEVAGVRDIEERLPMEADTIMRIYSMSKPITSAAAMILHERGKFSLDDPVAKYIPAFEKTTVFTADEESPASVPAKRQITVRDLFRHTSGYSYGGGHPRAGEVYGRERMQYRPPHGMLPPDMTITEGAEALARIPGLHQPGAQFTYGLNTDLLGRLIEIWSGQSLDRFLQTTVFEPLEMVDTGFSVPPEKKSRFASCHVLQDGKLLIADKAATSPYNDGFKFLSGGGGLVSTLQDYANFCQMLVDGGAFKGRRLLSEESVRTMFTDQLDGVAGEFKFGLGFAIGEVTLGAGAGERKAMQYSWAGYASTDFRIVPSEKLILIFMRQLVPSSHDLANKLFSIIYAGVR